MTVATFNMGEKFSALYEYKSRPLHAPRFSLLSMPLKDRVAQIIRTEIIRQIDLATVAGCTKGLVNQWLSGETRQMGFEYARKIHLKYGYRIEWLIDGKGKPKPGEGEPTDDIASLAEDEAALLELWGYLEPVQQKEWLGKLRATADANRAIARHLGNKKLDFRKPNDF